MEYETLSSINHGFPYVGTFGAPSRTARAVAWIVLVGAGLVGCLPAGGNDREKIANGSPANQEHHKAIAGLYSCVAGQYGTYCGLRCVATLYDRTHLATVAQCFRDRSKKFTYAVFNVQKNQEMPPQFEDREASRPAAAVRIKGIKVHPAYDASQNPSYTDLAVIELAEPAPETVTPVPLLPADQPLAEGDLIQVAGAGQDEYVNSPGKVLYGASPNTKVTAICSEPGAEVHTRQEWQQTYASELHWTEDQSTDFIYNFMDSDWYADHRLYCLAEVYHAPDGSPRRALIPVEHAAIFGQDYQLGGEPHSCIGDTGGPVFVQRGETWHFAAVASMGDISCVYYNTYALTTPSQISTCSSQGTAVVPEETDSSTSQMDGGTGGEAE